MQLLNVRVSGAQMRLRYARVLLSEMVVNGIQTAM
jgi:hypothetical protein